VVGAAQVESTPPMARNRLVSVSTLLNLTYDLLVSKFAASNATCTATQWELRQRPLLDVVTEAAGFTVGLCTLN
jgi:hypothetical protein